MKGLYKSIQQDLKGDHSIQNWILENAQYITMMGSRAYDTYREDSDYDLYGFTIPPKDYVFPFHYGFIHGFSKNVPSFDQFIKHGMTYDGKDVDIQLFSIVKYFRLLMDNNPNMLDSIFTKREYVIKCTKVAEMVRLNRKTFIHKGLFHKFIGYSFSQLKKAKSKDRKGKRKDIVDKYGFDTKFAGHVIRLLDEGEQLLLNGEMDITRANEKIKAINRGDVSLEEIESTFKEKEKYLTKLYEESKLPYSPDEEVIKDLLLRCLEEHFGSLDTIVNKSVSDKCILIRDIESVLERHR